MRTALAKCNREEACSEAASAVSNAAAFVLYIICGSTRFIYESFFFFSLLLSFFSFFALSSLGKTKFCRSVMKSK